MGYGIDERRISAGTNGDPLVGPRRHRVAVARIDDDDLCTALLERLFQVVRRPGTASLRFDGVLAEHHDELRVHDVGVRVGGTLAVQIRKGGGYLSRAVAAVAPQASAVHVDETRKERPDVAGVDARSIVIPDGFRTVFVEDTLIVIGNEVVGLVPGNLLELAFAAFADALHRVSQAVGMINPTPDGTTAQTCANLMIAVHVIARVVALHPRNFVVRHMQAQRAATFAVDGTMAPNHLLVDRLRCPARNFIGSLRRAREQRAGAQCGGAQAGQGRAFHERAARNGMLFRFRHDPSLIPSSAHAFRRDETPRIVGRSAQSRVT